MITDLKKFGLPYINNIKIENLRCGHGEVVCQLIDELVNMELYRRDFEFQFPTMPQDDEDNDDDGALDDFGQEQQF